MITENGTLHSKMTAFACSFPSLRHAPGIKCWDANELDRWAAEMPLSHGELCTARFVLAIWDSDAEWRCGRFDIMEALRIWDPSHHSVFLAWAA